MPRLTSVHWKRLKCVFEKAGFAEERTAGSHIVLVKKGVARPIVIPRYDAVGVDIVKSNLRTANMTREEYFRLLDLC